MESPLEKQTTTACCLQRFNCCILPFAATFICFSLFLLIIVASKLEDSAKNISWKEASLIGNAFRIDSQKLVLPILRKCDGPELSIEFFTSDNTKIVSLLEVPNSCGSSLSSWLGSSSTEISLYFLNTISDDIHAIVMQQDFIQISVENSNNTNVSDDRSDDFTVCVLPSNKNQNNEIKVLPSPSNIPEIAAFFESWIFYHASKFIIYDQESIQNNSNIFKLYNTSETVFVPFSEGTKEILKNANLLYAYDCFYRSQFKTHWTVFTTFDSIPMVQTRSSLSNILSTILISSDTENLVYQIVNDKSEDSITTIFDGKYSEKFDVNLQPVFKELNGKITQIPVELVKTYNILQLNSELFQQANTSAMNQIFSTWKNQYNYKVLNSSKYTVSL